MGILSLMNPVENEIEKAFENIRAAQEANPLSQESVAQVDGVIRFLGILTPNPIATRYWAALLESALKTPNCDAGLLSMSGILLYHASKDGALPDHQERMEIGNALAAVGDFRLSQSPANAGLLQQSLQRTSAVLLEGLSASSKSAQAVLKYGEEALKQFAKETLHI